jgi:hypothetical protein
MRVTPLTEVQDNSIRIISEGEVESRSPVPGDNHGDRDQNQAILLLYY